MKNADTVRVISKCDAYMRFKFCVDALSFECTEFNSVLVSGCLAFCKATELFQIS